MRRFGEGIVQGTESLGQSVLDILNPTMPVFTNEPTIHIGPGKPLVREKISKPPETLTGRYIKEPAEREEKIALKDIRSGHPVKGAAHMAAAAIPVVGPGVAGLAEEAASGNVAGALGQSVPFIVAGKAAEGEIPGKGMIDTIREAVKATPKEISRVASPGLEAASEEVKGRLNDALTQAEGRAKPLFENIDKADKERIEQEGAPGSIDISRPLDELNKEYVRRYGATEAPRLIQSVSKSLENMTNGTLALSDMTTARALRSAISNAIDIATSRGDRPVSAILTGARQALTDAMRDRADKLGLKDDFDIANLQWREIQDAREKLTSILNQEDSRKVLSDIRKGSPEMKNAMDKLERYGLLDKARVDDLAEKAERVAKATGKVYTDWFKRMLFGYAPAGVLLYLGQKYGIIPHTPMDWLIRYGGGMGGAALGELAHTRLQGMEAAKGLPSLVPSGPGFSAYQPSTPAPYTPPPAPPKETAPKAIPRTSATPPPNFEPGPDVPLQLRPGPFERPLEDAMSQLLAEERARARENEATDQLEKSLKAQMEKEAEKKRAKYRIQEAMRPYKKR